MAEELDIRWVDEIDSTQNAFHGHIPSYDNLSVVAALSQTAGRGQRGNTWLADRGKNLTFSMLLKFGAGGLHEMKAADQFDITRAATMGVIRYLDSRGIEGKVKWPNDIYIRNKKICGMLIENVLDGDSIAYSIVGIGLNVNQRDFPVQLANPTSMTLLTGEEYDLRPELEDLCHCLSDAFCKEMGTVGLAETYENRLFRLGVFHDYVLCSDGSEFKGRIKGTTKSGLLLVENSKGELKEFAFKEISYII